MPALQTQPGGFPVESDGHAPAPAAATQAQLENDVFTAFWVWSLQRHWSPTIWPPEQLIRVQTLFTARWPSGQLQTPDPYVPPTHGGSTHLPAAFLVCHGAHGASGAQLGPAKPALHTQFGCLPVELAGHAVAKGVQFGGVPVVPAGQAVTIGVQFGSVPV